MKKLALALVCLVSVAFFASCDPKVENPQPSIAVLTDTNYIQNGQVIEWGVDYLYGFKVASNPETQKELKSFKVVCGDQVLCDSTISGKEFTFEGGIVFSDIDAARVIVDTADIVATVTDVAGEFNNASIQVIINKEEYLVADTLEWRRDNGAAGTGMEKFGLMWEKNIDGKTVAKILPLEGAKLIEFKAEDWTNTATAAQKAALFSEAEGIPEFTKVSTTASAGYDLVLGTIYNGNTYLIHIKHCEVYERGWHFVITGEWK